MLQLLANGTRPDELLKQNERRQGTAESLGV